MRELEQLAHTLTDIKSVLVCAKKLSEKSREIIERLEPRIEMLEQRIDRMVINNPHKMDDGSWPT